MSKFSTDKEMNQKEFTWFPMALLNCNCHHSSSKKQLSKLGSTLESMQVSNTKSSRRPTYSKTGA